MRLGLSPQKILVIGTLGSGKTTLAKYLKRDTGFQYASIDECRIRFGDGTVSGEDCAWDSVWSREPGFHATRQEFRSTTSVGDMYSVLREICSGL